MGYFSSLFLYFYYANSYMLKVLVFSITNLSLANAKDALVSKYVTFFFFTSCTVCLQLVENPFLLRHF
jgi:hypothetical protein